MTDQAPDVRVMLSRDTFTWRLMYHAATHSPSVARLAAHSVGFSRCFWWGRRRSAGRDVRWERDGLRVSAGRGSRLGLSDE